MTLLNKGDPEDTKLVVLPASLVDRLRALALEQGVSLSNYAADALEQVLRADGKVATLEEAIDLHRIVKVQRGSGAMNIPRSRLNDMVEELYFKKPEGLKKAWHESGRWYGEYLGAKLGEEEAFTFLEKALIISWNLDELELMGDEFVVTIRFASFVMSEALTELFISFISGMMGSFGYSIESNDYLKGLGSLSYKKVPLT